MGSVVLGFGHLYQGVSGLVTTALIGFLYALEAVFAPATYSLLSIALGYAVYHGRGGYTPYYPRTRYSAQVASADGESR